MQLTTRRVATSAPAHGLVRREPRHISAIPVTVMRFLRYGPVVTPGIGLDISLSGMSILVCGAPRVGETVVIAPRSMIEPIDIVATVRYSTDARAGFQFFPLSPAAEKTINEWIRGPRTQST